MATIYKRKQSPVFYAAFTDEFGKRVFRSTGTKDKTEAQGIVSKWVREVRDSKNSTKAEQRKVSSVIIEIEQLANKGDLTEKKAREAILKIFEVTSGKKLKLYTVRQWLEHWRGIHSKTESKSSTESRDRSIQHILLALGAVAEKRIDLVTSEDLEVVKDWLEAQQTRSGKPVRKSTQNIKLAHMRAAFEEACLRSIIPTNPAKAIKNFSASDSEIVGYFNELELHKLIGAAEGQWRDIIILAAHTGLRRENLLRLRWSEVDLVKRSLFVALVKQKDGTVKKVAAIPLTLDALQVVSSHKGNGSEFVFSELSKLKSTEPNRKFTRIMKSAGVPRKIKGDGDMESKRSFHSLRHSFVSLLAKGDVAPEIRQELTGHADAAVHQIYSHLDQEVLKKASRFYHHLPQQHERRKGTRTNH